MVQRSKSPGGEPEPPHDVSAEFIGLITSHQRRLYAFIFSLVRNAADADDVLQETNLVLWRKSDEFEPGTNFQAWSFRVAQFQVMAYRKRRQRRGAREFFDDELIARLADEATERIGEEDTRQFALQRCLQKLKPEQRQLIAERYEPGGCVNDMAERIGKSPKAVSESLRRIRKNLMTCIERAVSQEASAYGS